MKKYFIFFLLLIAGCMHPPKPILKPLLSPAEVRFAVMDNFGSFKTFSAEGTISIESPSIVQSIGFELAVMQTDSLKITVSGPFGITVGTGLILKDSFAVYNALNNTLYKGNSFAKLKSFPMADEISPQLLMTVLQGKRLMMYSKLDSFDIVSGVYTMKFFNYKNEREVFVFDESVMKITEYERKDSTNNTIWEEEYHYSSKTSLIHQIIINIPSKQTVLTIDYSSVVRDAPVPPFTLSYPQDAEIILVQ